MVDTAPGVPRLAAAEAREFLDTEDRVRAHLPAQPVEIRRRSDGPRARSASDFIGVTDYHAFFDEKVAGVRALRLMPTRRRIRLHLLAAHCRRFSC